MAKNAAVAIETHGLRKVNRAIKNLGVESKDLSAAMQRVGSILVPEVRELAPTLTGALDRSVKASRSQNRIVVQAGSKKVPYVGVQNFGWPGHNIEGKHFMENAVKDKHDAVIAAIEDELNKLIDEAGLSG